MLRALYNFLFILAVPIVFARLWWRGGKQSLYRQHWRERLGYLPFKLESCVWIHMVSLGESVAAGLAGSNPTPIEFVAVDDHFGESGKPEELLTKYGLSKESIVEKSEAVLKRK